MLQRKSRATVLLLSKDRIVAAATLWAIALGEIPRPWLKKPELSLLQ